LFVFIFGDEDRNNNTARSIPPPPDYIRTTKETEETLHQDNKIRFMKKHFPKSHEDVDPWKEHFDRKTGKTRWINVKTGEEKPEGETEKPQTRFQQLASAEFFFGFAMLVCFLAGMTLSRPKQQANCETDTGGGPGGGKKLIDPRLLSKEEREDLKRLIEQERQERAFYDRMKHDGLEVEREFAQGRYRGRQKDDMRYGEYVGILNN